MPKKHKVLVIDSGKMTAMIVQALKELGIEYVIASSAVDNKLLPIKSTDEKICVGPELPFYNIIAAALSAKATAIHAGNSGLSQNQWFILICQDYHLLLIGPCPENADLAIIKKQIELALNLKGVKQNAPD